LTNFALHTMKPRLLSLLAALALAQGGGAWAQPAGLLDREHNAWPVSVTRQASAAGNLHTWSGAGPFLFSQPAAHPEGYSARGFRPFWVEFNDAQGALRSGHVLFPLFNYLQDETTYRWSLFELVRRQGRRPGAPAPVDDFDQRDEFEIFPFWFQRDFAEPELNYRALFPIHGTLRGKYWLERASWTLFPFYLENERRGAVSTYTPWPFVRVTRGAAQGWGVWPFYSTLDRPGVSRETYALWPLGFDVVRQPATDDPPGTPPRRETGALPFYLRSTGPGYASETWLWPFFGYTDRTLPVRYHELRYLWPFAVQGRGDEAYVNRWAPFYSHSVIKGYAKWWYAWPLVRHAQWTEEGIARTRSQFLYFVYWHEQQRVAGRAQSPVAGLTHFWPFYSFWDSGAGHRQWQFFSPLEVFFPGNPKVRQAWSPFFAVARHDERAPGHTRTSLLWNAVTWEKQAAEERSELHVGPLLGVTRAGAEKRITVGNGLFGLQHSPATGWRMFWWDFPGRRSKSN
jgi:hypothetical protein